MTQATGIYLHMPFCPYICPYCDFAKEPWRASREDRYLQAIVQDIERAPKLQAQTIFVGGGTPNMTDPQVLASLIDRVRNRFALVRDAEISVECNPDPQRRIGLEYYVAAGVNRISIGAQSFVAAELKSLGRQHTADDVADLVKVARKAGIDQISIDLLFAAPGQTVESLEYSLHSALALGIDHISCYGLTIEEDTPFAELYAKNPGHFASNDHEAELYAYLISRLEAAGFEQYELSNFARPNSRCKHNENYWANGDYLGFGVGAASYRNGRRWTNTRSIDEYCTALAAGQAVPADSETLTGDARLGEAAMLALRRREGINALEFGTRYAIDFVQHYDRVISEYTTLGLLEYIDGCVRLTKRGKPLANEVCAAFIALPEAA